MDHQKFLKSLSVEERQHLTVRSDAAGLVHLAAHWGAILLVGALIVWRVPGWQGFIAIQGVLIIFLFTLLHETCHLTPFRTKALNTVVGHVCGFLLILPANWFRYFHLAHHKFTQDPENDPELSEGKPETVRDYAIHISGLPVWRGQISALLRNALGKTAYPYVPQGKRGTLRTEARAMIGCYAALGFAAVALGLSDVVFVWLLPILIGQPFLRLYLLAEHGRCPAVSNMFENTRTTFTIWIVVSSPGTCRFTPSTIPIRMCRSIGCRSFMSGRGRIYARPRTDTHASIGGISLVFRHDVTPSRPFATR